MLENHLVGTRQNTSRWRRTPRGLLVPAILFLAAIATLQGADEDRPIVVGVHENEPLVYTNANGHPSGLFIDLLKDWATRENRKLQYKHGSLAELLNLAASGQVDIVPAVPRGEKPPEQVEFTRNYVVENWAWLYVRLNSPIRDFDDLAGKRVAGASGDQYFKDFEGIVRDMNVQAQLATYPTREDALQAVAAGQADAAVADRLSGQAQLSKLDLQDVLRVRCSHFAQKRLAFAVSKKAPPALVDALDAYLVRVKSDPHSVYYSAISDLFALGSEEEPRRHVPAYIFWVIGGLALGLLAAAGLNAVLRREVTRRTAALRESEEKYHHLFDGLSEAAFLADAASGNIVEVNAQAEALLGKPRRDIVGLHYADVNPSSKTAFYREKFEELRETGGPVTYDAECVLPSGKIIPIEVNAKLVDTYGRRCVMVLCRDLTALHKAEEALKESEERYRSIFETAGSLIVCMDINGTVRDCNSRIQEFTGYKRDEIIGRSMFKFVHPDFQKQAQESLHEVMVQGSARNHEYRLIRKDGSTVHARINSAALRNPQGEFTEVVLIMNDITAIKRTQDALRESEARFRRFAEASVEGIAFHDKGVIMDANASFARLFGYDLDEVIGKHVGELAAPESRELVMKNVLSGHELPYEAVGLRKDGTRVVGELCGRAVPYKGRTVRVTIVRDLSERKRAEEAIRQERDRAQRYLDVAQVMLVALSLDGNITMINQQGCRVLGHEERYLIGKKWFDTCVPEHVRAEMNGFFHAFVHGQMPEDEGLEYENPVLTKSGEERIIEWRNVLVKDNSGNVVGALSSGEDVTAQRRAEKALLRREEQLRQAAKMESIGRLAGGVAHEFNNLLTGIIGFTEFALDSLPTEHSAVRDLAHVQKLADRAAGLTKQLLAFGRAQRLQTVVLNMNGMVDEMSKMLRHLIGEDIELAIVKEPDLGNTQADPGQLEQVLMNLAINAREAMREGGKLTIETANVMLDDNYAHAHVDALPGPHVMLAVTDTGHGMDKETMEHLFEPFFTTKKEMGMGLGLATVYGIIRQHGASISVTSARGKGTSFKMFFPRVDEEAEPLPPLVIEAPAGSETILVVEDEESVRELAKTALARSGYRVFTAASTTEAQQLAAKHGANIAMVLTDVVMPDGNGYELYERLVSKHASLKVLYMSGYTADHLSPNAHHAKGAPFIMKPFTPAALSSEVRKVLDEKS